MNKVIFINRYFYPDNSATSQLLSDLAFDLRKKEMEVVVIACRQLYSDKDVILPKKETIRGVVVYRLWSTIFGRANLFGRLLDYLTFYVSLPFVLIKVLSKDDIVVAKTDPPLISILSAIIVRIKGGILINWVQDIFPEIATALGMKGQYPFIITIIKYFRNKSWKAAAYNVVLGQRMFDYVVGQGVSRNQVKINHNWSDGKLIIPILAEKNFLRKKWNLTDKFVIGYSGNMGLGRDFSTILDMALQFKNNNDIVFLFIGGGGQREFIEKETFKLNLENIMFRDYQPRDLLSESLSVSDVHIISLQPEIEGFVVPSKFYGIAAVGRPTLYIGDEIGEIPMILKEENIGFTISVGCAKQGVKFINDLYKDHERLTEMGAKARRVFDKRFDRKIATSFWHKIILSCYNA